MTAELRWLNPATLLVDVNIRTDLNLDAGFVDSIRQHGVIMPVVAVTTEQGVRVRAGNRRTVAAVEAALDSIPVVVVDDSDDDTQRIVQQLVENTHREALTPADTLAAVEQLALLGVDASTIAKRTALPKATVGQAIAAAASPAARRAVTEHPALTLEHAGWLAEFDEFPNLRDRLAAEFTGDPGRDRHLVERMRQDLSERRAFAIVAERLAADHPGAPRVDANTAPSHRSLGFLGIDVADHTGCPGHAWTLNMARSWWGDDVIDAAGHPLIEQDGHRFYIKWVCTDPAGNGHRDTPQPTTPSADDTAARVEHRRRTVALNKAGAAAEKVRCEWLTEFTRRTQPPKGHAEFLFAGVALRHEAASYDVGRGMDLLAKALHLPPAGPGLDTWLAQQTQTHLAHLVLCARLWAYESRAGKDLWQQETRRRDELRRYLLAIEQWGYQLADVERIVTGDRTADQVYAALRGDR